MRWFFFLLNHRDEALTSRNLEPFICNPVRVVVTICNNRSCYRVLIPFYQVAIWQSSRKMRHISPFSFFFLCRKSEKLHNRVFPVTPLLSIVFVPRVFCAYLR